MMKKKYNRLKKINNIRARLSDLVVVNSNNKN